ncbi:MAG: glycosyltransferase [Gaiellaceae bacterium]
MPDRVGHLVSQYLPRSATFIYTVLRFQQGVEPVVLAGYTRNLHEFPHDRVVELSPPGRSFAARSWPRISARLRGYGSAIEAGIVREAASADCRLLHAHFGWMGIPAIPAARRLGIPVVTTFYGRDLIEADAGRDPEPAYRELFAEGAAFLCEGPTMAMHLKELGCPPEKVRLVRIGLDLTKFPYAPRRREQPLIVFQASRLSEKKGVDLSLRAYAQVRGELGPSELWIVGGGYLRATLEALAEELGLGDSVRFFGSVNHAEYRDLIGRAHIGIQPSRVASDGDTEGGAPTVLLEMQAIGIPVVATKHADIPYVVASPDELAEENDVDGIAASLARLASCTDSEWDERVRRGRAQVEKNHDARSIALQIEAIYAECGVGAPARRADDAPNHRGTRLRD